MVGGRTASRPGLGGSKVPASPAAREGRRGGSPFPSEESWPLSPVLGQPPLHASGGSLRRGTQGKQPPGALPAEEAGAGAPQAHSRSLSLLH